MNEDYTYGIDEEDDLIGNQPINLPDPSLFSDLHDNELEGEGNHCNHGKFYNH